MAAGTEALQAGFEGVAQGDVNCLLIRAWPTKHGGARTIGSIAVNEAAALGSNNNRSHSRNLASV
ncbi:hypothetical protein AJ88_24830 [Mesorhizobium amorphae CCBAU 01583]|nr:hypothetical protein AJ88_24830 [Mesorhizobium amorphae CCBAU 01583]